MRTIVVYLLFVAAVAGPPEVASDTDQQVAAPSPARVVIRVTRSKSVAGYVELEDDHVIVVRTRDGEVREFARARILQVVSLTDPKPGQRGVVHLRDGQRRQGIIIEDAFDYVLLEIEGIRAKIPRDAVDFVALAPTFDEQYARFKATLKPNMTARHLALCRWLIDQRRYELARQELTDLLATTDVPEARRLLRTVNAQLTLLGGAEDGGVDVASESNDGEAESDARRWPPPWNLLTHEDVNLIRVYEIDFKYPPKVAVSPETIRKLIDRYVSNPAMPSSEAERTAMFRADPFVTVKKMFEVRARDLYPEIQVLTEPRALNMFRQRVHATWLMNSCASTQCHGRPGAGRLLLYRDNHRSARVWMTNLLILERLEVDPEWRLVDFEEPMKSLIIQYGLPRETARQPHPDVRGWKPVFTQTTRPLLEDTLQWMDAMMKPRPDYPVDFEPPTGQWSDLEQAPEAPEAPKPPGRPSP